MYLALHVLAAVLATWRMTELVLGDKITEPLRKMFPKTYLLNCPRCMSVWAGFVAAALFLICPWLNWPLALAWTYLWHMDSAFMRRTAREGRQFVIHARPDGKIELIRSEITQQELNSVVNQLLVKPTEVKTGGSQ